jgi:co-chaperonin GroES (HSP10)
VILPTRGKALCEILSRDRQLASGLWMADKQRHEKKDNVARCLGVGDLAYKQDPWEVRRTDIIHFKQGFGKKFDWEGRKLIALKPDEIIAVEREGQVIAVGKTVICKLRYAEKLGSIIVPDNAKQNSGDYVGIVISVGKGFKDKSLKAGDEIIYLRNEGYRFRMYEGREELLSIKECWCYGKQQV